MYLVYIVFSLHESDKVEFDGWIDRLLGELHHGNSLLFCKLP